MTESPEIGASLAAALAGSRYQDYLYAYPHKTAYRSLAPAVPLGPLWAGERRGSLFLYVHVPFCEMRCGFCNLFTRPMPPHAGDDERVRAYTATLARQARVVRRALDEGGPFAFARVAIGGGTPTFLAAALLERVLDVAAQELGASLGDVPMSVETSPTTATPDRLRLLVARGADRVSMGIQSFVDAESRAAGRPQDARDVHRALEAIRAAGPRTLNVDLMYGLPGQTAATWLDSLEQTLRYRPEEVYLYPTYARPLTPLGRRSLRANGAGDGGDERPALYRLGRDRLRAAGYRQVSMRMFRLEDTADVAGPVYCCQDDGMVGLGCGARSYTRGLHHASEYAVGARGVRGILDRWIGRADDAFAVADHGIVLDDAEQRRRWLILSILAEDGASRAAYRDRFGGELDDDAPELTALAAHGLAAKGGDRWRLTDDGMAASDAIGPWLVSPAVRAAMGAWEAA